MLWLLSLLNSAPEPQAVAAKAAKMLTAIRSFNGVVTYSSFGKSEVFKVSIAKPFRTKIESPYRQWWVDGKSITQVFPGRRAYDRMPAADTVYCPEELTPLKLFAGDEPQWGTPRRQTFAGKQAVGVPFGDGDTELFFDPAKATLLGWTYKHGDKSAIARVQYLPSTKKQSFAFVPPAGYRSVDSGSFSGLLPVGAPLPDMKLTGADGKTVAVKDLWQGKRGIIVSFFSLTCGPCIAEMRHLKPQYASLKRERIDVASFSMDSPKDIAKLAKKEGLSWTFATGQGRQPSLESVFQIGGLPTSYAVDGTGHVTAAWQGFDKKALDSAIQTLRR